MSKTTLNKILAKLAKLDEYLAILLELSKKSQKQFVADYHIYGLAERYLQLSIEVILDIAKLLVIELNLSRPENNSDLFEMLSAKKIITAKLAAALILSVGFRNVLVHDYEKIDRSIVYSNLKSGMSDLKEFKRRILTKFYKNTQ